jgi:hypothetical protein
MEIVEMLYDHLEYFTVFFLILWSFDVFCGHCKYFTAFRTFSLYVLRKICQPHPIGALN